MVQSPFLYLTAPDNRRLGWVLITAPITDRAHHLEFAELSRLGYRFGGMPGYLTFPRADSSDKRDYGALCEFWCHCFREPDLFLPAGTARALISYSDFTDPMRVSPEKFKPAPTRAFEHDFIYVGAREPWKRAAKNWPLAARCIPRICQELDLRAMVIGEPDEAFPGTPQIRFKPQLDWKDFLCHLAVSRFLLVPNLLDPSPRVLAEALCLDIPVVVNQAILGGWKYVNAFTGQFFENEFDVVSAVEGSLSRASSPRRWFSANYGPYLSGKRLLNLLRYVDQGLPDMAYVRVKPSINLPTDPQP